MAVERLSSDQEVDRRAAGAVWDAFLGDLGSLLLLVAAFATVVAAAVASQSTLPDLVPALKRGWELASRKPRRTVWRVGARGRARRLGVAIVVDPLRALRLVAIGGGLVVLYVGVDELLQRRPRTPRRERAEIGRRDLVASFAPVAVGLVAFAAVGLFVATGGATAAGRDPHRGLQRPRGAVLEAPERGHAARVAQLDVVVRRGGLVLRRPHAVDRRPAARRRARAADRRALRAAGRQCGADGPVASAPSRRATRIASCYLQTLGPEGLAAIQRIRDRVLPGEGKPGVFLCHRFCELGATEITGRRCATCGSSSSSIPDEVARSS